MSVPSISQNPLGYQGIDFEQNPPVVRFPRAPAATDLYISGTIWVDQASQVSYVSGAPGVWAAVAGAGAGVNTLTGNSGGAISPTAGNINIVGTGAITVSGAGSTLTINSGTPPFSWINNATGTQLVSNTGYIVTTGNQIFTMPSSAQVGDIITVLCAGVATWSITVGGAPNEIHSGSSTASTSVSGTSVGSVITMVCTVFINASDQDWYILNYDGNVSLT